MGTEMMKMVNFSGHLYVVFFYICLFFYSSHGGSLLDIPCQNESIYHTYMIELQSQFCIPYMKENSVSVQLC